MESKLDIFLESFNKSVLEVTKGSYGGKWPMPFFSSLDVGMVVGEYWGDFFLEVIRKIKRKGINVEDLSEKIKYPSPFSRAFYPNVELKYKGYPPDKLEEIDRFVSELIYPLYKADIFCANGTNILWDKNQIDGEFNIGRLIWLRDLKNSTEMIRYNGYLRAITEMLFFYWDNFGHETHGPYKLESGDVLLIREWHDLKPGYFKFSEKFPFDYLRVYELYKPGTVVKIDVSNRVYIDARIDDCLLGFRFYTVDKTFSFSETEHLIEEIRGFCEMGVRELVSMKPEQILENAAYMHFYLFKPLTDILGISWKPGRDCLERIRMGITVEDKEAFRFLIRLNLDNVTIKRLFDCRLSLPSCSQ